MLETATRPARPPVRIGHLTLKSPFFQAALSGYSDWPMRILARRQGAAYTLTEVMLDQFLLQLKNRDRTRHHLYLTDEDHPVAGQLMGADPVQFAPAAQRLAQAGFDVIDINFGCPVKKVLGRCRGGYHLGQPAVALEIVSRVREAVPAEIPVTLKMRRGLDDSAESRDRFFEIFAGAADRGVAAITVHGRTVAQKYVGPSSWSFLKDVKAIAGALPVFGSGDLFTAQDCIKMLQETGVAGVTIARGAIGNPWIFAQCQALWDGDPLPPPPSVFEQRALLEEHLSLATVIYGEERVTPPLRKFGIKYARLHPQPETVRHDFAIAKCTADWRKVLASHYATDAPGQFPTVDEAEGE